MRYITATFNVLVFGLALAALVGGCVSPNTPDQPYVLTVVASRYLQNSTESVSMQEFTSEEACRSALGFVKGATDRLTAECLKK